MAVIGSSPICPILKTTGAHIRHFLLPIFVYQHPAGGKLEKIALVNRKRGLKNFEFEGAIGLFGGAAEPNESRMDTLLREIWNDGPKTELPGLPKNGTWGKVIESPHGQYTMTAYRLDRPLDRLWDQKYNQELSACCAEGSLDWIRQKSPDWRAARWLYEDMPLVIDRMWSE